MNFAAEKEMGHMQEVIAVLRRLKAGDKVLMLRVKGGQQYIILSKLR